MAESFTETATDFFDLAVISVSAFSAKHGPCGNENRSLEIKRDALREHLPVVLATEAEKLAYPDSDLPGPRVWRTKSPWAEFARREDWYIVTTKLPGVEAGEFLHPPSAEPRSVKDWYLRNRKLLKMRLGDRFIEA